MKIKHTLILAAVIVLTGCATAPKMNNLSIGMTKKDVLTVMGTPASTAAPGNGVEVLRYELSQTSDAAYYGITQEYFVKLVGGRVDSYGRMGDFNSTQDPTVNLNIKNR